MKDDTMRFTRWYNLMALFWTMQFLIGCQHMTIAGSVAIWYFTRYDFFRFFLYEKHLFKSV